MSTPESATSRENLLGRAFQSRNSGDQVLSRSDFLQFSDSQFSGDQLAEMVESNQRDCSQYLDRAQKLGLVSPDEAQSMQSLEHNQLLMTVAKLMPDILIEERNLDILFTSLERQMITEEEFIAVMALNRDDRTMICNDLHTKARVRAGEALQEMQLTFAGVGIQVKNVVNGGGSHPLASALGVSF